jgi:branched-chain amino acid transport system substrate-binding protein
MLSVMALPHSINAQSDETKVVVAAGENIKLGLATDLSNIIPEPGADIRNGATIAVMQYNGEFGGIQGFQVELDVQDDRCDGADATNVANLFASDPQIVGVVGHVCSGASIPASAIYQDARIPMVSASSTAAAFTAQGFDVVNRVAFTDAAQGTVDARFIFAESGLAATKLAIIHDNSDYGKGLSDQVKAEFELLGGTVSAFEAIDVEDQDYRPVLTVIAADAPEVIFFGGYEGQAALLISQMKEVGLEDTLFMSDDGTFTQGYIDQAGEAAEGSYASFVDSSSFADAEKNATFDEIYEEAFGVAPDDLGPFHAHAYDATMVLLNAINAVAVLDDAGNLVIDREALILAVRATKDYEGLTGTLSCDENGECGAGVIGMNVVEDGAWVAVEVDPALQFKPVEVVDGGETTGEMAATIIEAAQTAGTFTALLTAVEAAGLTEMLMGEGPFTVFAPSDEVFAALPPGTLEAVLADPDMLMSILQNHVVEGQLLAADLAGMTTVTTVGGGEITITVGEDGTITLGDDTHIVMTDIITGNGVIHVIDGVLVP